MLITFLKAFRFSGFHGSCSYEVSLLRGRGGGGLYVNFQHPPETDSVTLKMAAGHSSEIVGHTFTTQCENLQNDH